MRQVAPRLVGRPHLIRYADDAVIIFEQERDARRVLDVLPKRLAKYSLTLHPEKTRPVDFRRPDQRALPSPDKGDACSRSGAFDLLGFTHYWARSRKGYWVVKQKTAQTASGARSSAWPTGAGVIGISRCASSGSHSRRSCWGTMGISASPEIPERSTTFDFTSSGCGANG